MGRLEHGRPVRPRTAGLRREYRVQDLSGCVRGARERTGQVVAERERQAHLRESCAADPPTFANLPGQLAAFWLRDPETNSYGGLYLWDDQEAYERYIKGDVFNAIQADQTLENDESRDFGVFEDLSSLT